MRCRHCKAILSFVFCDLQTCPPSNAMVKLDSLHQPEIYYPLKVYTCTNCWLVQVDEFEKAENLFNDEYTYFSSYSQSWLAHARTYTDYMCSRFGYGPQSFVVEIASNDGYLLQYFKEKNIPVLGVEPTANTAEVAMDKGINTLVEFFGSRLALENLPAKADLLLGNNVLAHVPDINDFVKGVKIALKPGGVNTFEFPHLCQLVEHNQFDTIYHEHFSYLSLTTVSSIFKAQGLDIFDVQELPTHGGSLRIFSKHREDLSKPISSSVTDLLAYEASLGIQNLAYYKYFQQKVDKIKNTFIQFLLKCKFNGKKVIGYGAAAKGNTLLNYCGIKGNDLISFVSDISPNKQGKYLPGSRIAVKPIEDITLFKPDFIVIFPWNLKTEISDQLAFTREWNAKLVITLPEFEIF